MKRLESFFLVMHTQWVSVVYQVYPMMKVHDMGKIHHGIVAKDVEFFVAKTGCHVYHPPVITIFWLVVWLSFPGKWVVKMTLFYPHTNWISPKKTLEPTNPWNIWSTHFTNLMLSADHNWLRPGFQRFFIKEHEIKTPPIFTESFLKMGDPQNHRFQYWNGLILDDLGVPPF